MAYQYFCPCGECRSCRKGTTPRCRQGLRYRLPPTERPHFNAAYGQYYYVRQSQAVFKVPDNVPDVLAGPANCALSQVIDGLERARVGPGDTLVDSGGRGSGHQRGGRRQGTGRDAGDRDRWDRVTSGLAIEFGADVTIDLNEFKTPAARVARVRELTDGEGADAVMELVGSAAIVAEGIEMLCSGGVYLEIGNVNQRLACEFNPASLVHGGKTILGLMWYRPESLQQALQLLSKRADRYPFHKLLSHQYPLSAIDDAFRDQDAGVVHRAALLPWG